MEDSLWCLAADKEHVKRRTVAEELHRTGGMVSQRQLAVVGGVVESTIHAAAEVERDVLIAPPVVDTLTVLVLQLEGLPAEIHLPEPLSRACKALVRGATEGDGGTFGSGSRIVCCGFAATYRTEAQRERVVAGRRKVVVAEGYGLVRVSVRVEGNEWCRLGCRQQVAPGVGRQRPVVDDGTNASFAVADCEELSFFFQRQWFVADILMHCQHQRFFLQRVAIHADE